MKRDSCAILFMEVSPPPPPSDDDFRREGRSERCENRKNRGEALEHTTALHGRFSKRFPVRFEDWNRTKHTADPGPLSRIILGREKVYG